MPRELHVNDSGTWRRITEVHVNDSGTWRRLTEIHVNDNGTWRMIFPGDISVTMTAGLGEGGNPAIGFVSGLHGSLSPSINHFPGGEDIVSFYDFQSGGSIFSISGFGADPGQSFFTSVVANSVTRTSASADSYFFSSGQANWSWNTGGWGFVNGNPYPTTIVMP